MGNLLRDRLTRLLDSVKALGISAYSEDNLSQIEVAYCRRQILKELEHRFDQFRLLETSLIDEICSLESTWNLECTISHENAAANKSLIAQANEAEVTASDHLIEFAEIGSGAMIEARIPTEVDTDSADSQAVAVVEMREVVKAKVTQVRQLDLAMLRKTFCQLSRELEESETFDHARIKQAVCVGRAYQASLKNPMEQATIDDEIAHLKRLWNHEFFGYGKRELPADTWWKAALAYEALGIAIQCFDLLDFAIATDPGLVHAIGAAVVCPRALFQEKIHAIHDCQQQENYEQFRTIVGDRISVLALGDTLGFAELLQAASTLGEHSEACRAKLAEQKRKEQKKVACDAALDEIVRLMGDRTPREDFEQELESLLVRALEAGVPPSNKVLRDVACNYVSIAKQLSEKLTLGKKLFEFARLKLTKDLTAHNEFVGEVEPIEDDDPEVLALREHLAGKRVLFVGGNKGQHQRKRELIEKFGLKDLDWPDAEEKTHVGRLSSHVAKADVVVQLIRFSRHSYKQVLDEAKQAGKQVARLTHGLGLRTITHQLHQQLVGRVSSQAA